MFRFISIVTLSLLIFLSCNISKVDEISLAGNWEVKLDSTNVGKEENWAATKFSGLKLSLPRTLDDAGIGKPNTLKPAINNYVMSNLTRKHQYIGKAWYQKEIVIPSDWKGKTIALSLERVIWESSVYLDGVYVGSANSLIGSHDFQLNKLKAGKHLLTIVIDNSNKFPFINVAGTKYPDKVNQDMAHAYTNHTQIKWNGILGNMILKVSNKNAPENLQVYPDVESNKLKITFNQLDFKDKTLRCIIKSINGDIVFNKNIDDFKRTNNHVSFEVNKPDKLEFWDEFNPNLYDVSIETGSGAVNTRFGFKGLSNNNGDLTLNGKRIFLRGNLECVIFPLTGYPPMQKEEWARLIRQAKAYGLNHLRFHSWCPPKAAFEAADEAGFYCQVELPHWSLKVGQDEKTTQFLKSEAHKIINDYGNHPSFLFMALGNELQGDASLLNGLVATLKSKDNRHMYATTAFSFQKPMGTRPEQEDEFFIAQWTDKGWIRGQGIFNSKPPHFNADYTSGSAHIKVPLISHEIGQYSVYPDMSEISKYTGVLEPLNFIAIKEDLEKKGLLDLAPDFTHNSGKLAALLYKEEIERALKTLSFDGFQLLQLQDFPGQGTALVGLLNAFWESKGVISPEEFRQFNSELVPLLRFEKAVYESGENFSASIEVANFYKKLENQTIYWTIKDDLGPVVYEGELGDLNLALGNNVNLGDLKYLIETKTAKRLTITLSLKGTSYKNTWHIWVYPKNVSTDSKGILITSSFAEAAVALNQGKKVFLNPDYKALEGIEGRFVPVFWSPVHFPNQPATMGLMLDNKHPAFNQFPTSTHTDWQWWDLCINSKSIITDSLNVEPIVRVIDNFVTNHHLASVFEAKVGNGRLVFSAIDLTSNLNERPVARQLRYSLLEYMNDDAFSPDKEIKIEDLNRIKLNEKNGSFSTTDIYN
ncbi:sugar-binding domain-containing protein [Aestuariibaculum suncheonense]|uniref:Glycoside hydrolase family 2 n=1 Tax=Aestuariibaculum suncheonense TaxID=1028745 RepID=A0A8J6QC48_9FLAO|nr:sugar-binding domain-containing protein [Aestuariibaculum suncheonense]MBD0834813.1 glycoside hydrolase family 2 [Aestuariibaculum suncheonense]